MTRRKTKMKSESYIEQAIVQLLSLKLRSGSSLTEVRGVVNDCFKEASLSVGARSSPRGLAIHKLGSILRAWHTESPYLTFDGLPRPLPTEGRPSLKALIRRFYAADKVDSVYKRLFEAKLIRRHQKDEWMPVSRSARIAEVSPESIDHVAAGIVRYIETVTRNVTSKCEENLLFERSCQVTSLPASEFHAFREYVGQQSIAFLTAIDDWLENRSKKSRKNAANHCTAGVHAFAFMLENRKARSALTRKKN